ncbi:transposase DDE domain protein [Leptospira weilii serovar Ranarum str. ICFT]|uniref:Transposase DDE domain protein n=1 Tax=Leptospira weilii serovar Ranarum str. ICFT TaxID=1218598 RepID=N1WG43_9LEPT|nr:transposase DDE domain protein [Leptospira weilii serovar Ranarum str. ICFT]
MYFSSGYRIKLWKVSLQKLTNEIKKITVCHFPSGTSRWNKIEHRRFSYIAKN